MYILLIFIIQNIICIVNQFTIDRILESFQRFVALCCNHSRFLLFLTPFFLCFIYNMSENVWHSKRTAKQQNLPLLTKCYSMALSIICYHKLSLAFCICSYPIFNNSSLYIFGMLSNLILITSLF